MAKCTSLMPWRENIRRLQSSGPGNMCFHRTGCQRTRAQARLEDIMWMRAGPSALSGKPPAAQGSLSRSARTRFDTLSQHIFWKRAMIFERSRSFLDTRMFRPPWSTPTSSPREAWVFEAPWTCFNLVGNTRPPEHCSPHSCSYRSIATQKPPERPGMAPSNLTTSDIPRFTHPLSFAGGAGLSRPP